MEFLIIDIGATLAVLVGYVASELFSDSARDAKRGEREHI
jgi:hypothetical protein